MLSLNPTKLDLSHVGHVEHLLEKALLTQFFRSRDLTNKELSFFL